MGKNKDNKTNAMRILDKNGIRYELETPVQTTVCLNGQERIVGPGKYTFWTAK